ncbi:MAG: TIGR03643 family protein [Saprospiraceae bacterium]|nr:TIGR03643 family protein [Saprospiraceae bacterium]
MIELTWKDRTPFEAIYVQFNLSEQEGIKLRRRSLRQSSFKLWRKRVNSGVSQKHLKKGYPKIDRFKCSRQKSKISKR